MAKFCTNCGHALDPGAAFCSNCGAPAAGSAQPQAGQEQYRTQTQLQWQQVQQPAGQWGTPQGQQTQQWRQPSAADGWRPAPGSAGGQWSAPARTVGGASDPGARVGVPMPGFSDRVNDPALCAALAKQKRASKRVAGFIVPIPLVCFAIYGMLSDNMEFSKALLYGAIVSAVFLIFSWIGKRQSSGKNAYDGVVVDKQTRRRSHSNKGNDSSYTELITVIRTNTGEQKRIVERDNSRPLAWDYLQIGEQFRYHPDHAFPYELYDKSHAPYLGCVVCQKKNPVTADRCQKCGTPLLK